ncbi:DUF1173 family protein, partial [Enterobacter roggenkampii]|uniref:DUF1173 family protein n=1 Tax=Enterobacter roggenkampii TaxID=1812935 RepID=UPI002FFBF58E
MSQKFAVMIAYDDDPNVKRYSPDFQTQDEFAKGWQSALKKAHHTSGQKSVITCGCRGKGEKRLYVRALPNGDAFILVKAANTGIEHDPSCVFFSLDARCQQRVKSDPLTATTNGLILIHLVYS